MPQSARKPGIFLRIPLPDGSFGYGRVLIGSFGAFYNYRTMKPEQDLDTIASKSVLFIIAFRHTALRAWDVIGWREVEKQLAQPIVQFTQDIMNFRACKIFDTVGNVRVAVPRECVGLEAGAVWEPHGVEERLLDTFMGRPNVDVEHLRVRLE